MCVCVSASGMYIYIYSHVKNICIYLHIYGSLLHATGGPCTRYIYKCHVQTQRFPAKDASHADVFDCRSRTDRRLGPDPCHASRGERCWAVTLCSFPPFLGQQNGIQREPSKPDMLRCWAASIPIFSDSSQPRIPIGILMTVPRASGTRTSDGSSPRGSSNCPQWSIGR